MFIQTFPSGPLSTNTYLVACLETKEAALIDASPECTEQVLACIDAYQLTCKKILLTHSHWDHIAEVSHIQKKLDVQVYIHSLDVPNLVKPGADGLPCWIPFPSIQPDVLLGEGDSIAIGQLTFKVIHTPGHSPGSVCFYSDQNAVLFSGDTLFKGSMGNLSFPTSQPAFMWASLAKLVKLPSQTKVYPGHGPLTTIGEESWLSQGI